MSSENAIEEEVETPEQSSEPVEEDGIGETDDYEVIEPDDDVEEFKVPIIDSIDDDDDSPSEKAEAKPAKKEVPVKDEKPKAETVKEVPKVQKTPDNLVDKAKKLGISDEDIKLFNNPEQLQRLINLVEPNVSTDKPSQNIEAMNRQPQAQHDSEFKLELDPELYDPKMYTALQSTAKEINGIKSALNNVLSVIDRQNAQSFEQEFESMLSGLGDEFSDTMGKGSLSEIGRDNDYYKNRCKLIDEMNAMAAGYSQTGKSMPAPKELFQRAVNGLFSDVIKKNTLKQISDKVQKRSSQIISRPTGKLGKDALSPDQRAASAVKEKLRQFGAYEETEAEEDF
jgi:hypothetical protein